MWLLAFVLIPIVLFLPTLVGVIVASVLVVRRNSVAALTVLGALIVMNLSFWLRLPFIDLDPLSKDAERTTLFLTFLLAIIIEILVGCLLLRFLAFLENVSKSLSRFQYV